MGIFSRWFGRKHDNESHEVPSMPWDQGPSILEFVRSHISPDTPGLSQECDKLPDEERVNAGAKIRWAAGAWDGVATHHMGKSENDDAVHSIVKLILAYSRQPTARNKAAVYQHIISEHLVSIIDPVIAALVKEEGINQERLYDLAYSFVTESPDREPVKFGIAILGLFRNAANHELFQTLGRHDEFTLFCAVALGNSSEDPDEALWRLARNVTGWGRIHVVERLSETTNPAIKNWLLREGFRNSVLYEYLAATCARTGGLLLALSHDQVDQELLTSSGEIIQALISGGPAENMDDYEDARPVIASYLNHAESRAETISDYLTLNAIQRYLAGEESEWVKRYESGWTVEVREQLRSISDAILARPEWQQRIADGLKSDEEVVFARANDAATSHKIDTWEIHWRRLQEKPGEPGRWYHVMRLCNEDRIDSVIEFAHAELVLSRIATGASNELGLGRGFESHSCLDYILQELGRFPGQGIALVESGLKSPVIRNRNLAVKVFDQWPEAQRGTDWKRSLERAVECEPEKDVRERMQKVLKGESISE